MLFSIIAACSIFCKQASHSPSVSFHSLSATQSFLTLCLGSCLTHKRRSQQYAERVEYPWKCLCDISYLNHSSVQVLELLWLSES